MPFFKNYRDHRFNVQTKDTVEKATQVINDLGAQGYTLTLRQLYYQFVSKNWIENSQQSYKRFGRIITNARESGRVDWLAIEDRQRGLSTYYKQENFEEVIEGLDTDITFEPWDRMDDYVEVWIEKQALENVVSRPCSIWRVPYMACKGYLSASEAWRAGLRYARAIDKGKKPVLIHLADHDPSGINMTDDNRERVRLFAESKGIEVKRIALNMDQVEKYNPPPNPAKKADSRSKDYIHRFGKNCWELDALEPKVLDGLITNAIKKHIDMDVWNDTMELQEEARRIPQALADNWDEVKNYMYNQEMI